MQATRLGVFGFAALLFRAIFASCAYVLFGYCAVFVLRPCSIIFTCGDTHCSQQSIVCIYVPCTAAGPYWGPSCGASGIGRCVCIGLIDFVYCTTTIYCI